MATPPELPRYVPVPPNGNGHKVRPDGQTKLVGMLIAAIFMAPIVWVGSKVSSLNDRVIAMENSFPERMRSLERSVDRLAEEMQGMREDVKALAKERSK